MREQRKCAYCGNTFIAKKVNAKYCSPECKNAQQKIYQRIWEKNNSIERKKKRYQERSSALNFKVRAANEAGMSYGKYVAMEYLQSQKKEIDVRDYQPNLKEERNE